MPESQDKQRTATLRDIQQSRDYYSVDELRQKIELLDFDLKQQKKINRLDRDIQDKINRWNFITLLAFAGCFVGLILLTALTLAERM